MPGLVSVIIPVYNVEKYLRQCIESIQKQSYYSLEIILINDGSTDNSGTICDEYAEKDSRIKVIHQTNNGVSAARNAGLEIASGEYISFVDSDDFITPDMYEIMINKALKDDADLVICRFFNADELGNICSIESPINDEILSGKEVFNKFYSSKYWHFITVWNRLYKSKVFSKLRFPEKKINEDQFITYDIYRLAQKVVLTSEYLYCYRNTQNSIMHKKNGVKQLDGIEASYRAFLRCEKENVEIKPVMFAIAMHQLNCFNNIEINSKQEKQRKKEVKRMIRYMFYNNDGGKTLKNFLRTFFPECYVCLRNIK